MDRLLCPTGRANRKHVRKNMAICTHLSACNTVNHELLGIAEPGRHNKITVTQNHSMAGMNRLTVKIEI